MLGPFLHMRPSSACMGIVHVPHMHTSQKTHQHLGVHTGAHTYHGAYIHTMAHLIGQSMSSVNYMPCTNACRLPTLPGGHAPQGADATHNAHTPADALAQHTASNNNMWGEGNGE